MNQNKKTKKLLEKQKLHLLCFSFYNLDYGIGASATFLDQLNSLPENVFATVIEPNRTDLPQSDVELSTRVNRIKIPLPLTSSMFIFYPVLAFFYGLKINSKIKSDVIFSMHHPFHFLSLTGHILSKIFHVPHVVALHDVWRPMGIDLTLIDYWADILEKIIAKLIKNDLMVFVCSEHRQILESRSKVKFLNSLTLPNCVSDSLIKGIQKKSIKSKNEINFIFVGRIGREYGLEKIQPIFDSLSSFGYEPHLLVAGHNQVGLPKYAKFVGNLTRRETIQLISESDVGIGHMYPTNTIPRKVVEYLALGKIVIIAKNSVSVDILRDYGELILEVSDADNPNQVAQKLLSLLNNPKDKPEKILNLYCSHRMKLILKRLLTKK